MKNNTTPADPEHEHYKWGASNAKTWRTCPGSINFTDQERAAGKIPEDTSSSYADEGTVAHDWADRCLKNEVTTDEIPPNIYESLEGYIDLARSMSDDRPEAQVFTEQKVALFYNLEKVGTLDYAVADNHMVEILDYKNGFQPVDVDTNSQLCIYARSLTIQLEEDGYEFTNETIIRMWIYQPNERAFSGYGKMWETTYEDLKDICMDIQDDYDASKEADVTDLTPTPDACMFCDAKVVCTARTIHMFDDVPEEANMLAPASRPDNVINLPQISTLNDAARLAIFKNHKEITKWMASVNADSLTLIEQGTAIEGMKVVEGKQGNRGWGDNELDAEKLMRKLPVALRYKPRRVLSPAQADTAIKKFEKEQLLEDPEIKPIRTTRFNNRFEELIFRKAGKPVLTTADDSRESRASAIESFDDEPIEVASEVVEDSDCF
tara:strand:+ start:839 stop:2146 length:1308 start_codon:yes stop_codon:yes gene_type:complete